MKAMEQHTMHIPCLSTLQTAITIIVLLTLPFILISHPKHKFLVFGLYYKALHNKWRFLFFFNFNLINIPTTQRLVVLVRGLLHVTQPEAASPLPLPLQSSTTCPILQYLLCPFLLPASPSVAFHT